MGSGKSSAAITYMNEHKRDKFIYITPYLDEAERIKDGCPALRFAEPSNKIEKYHFKKTEHTAGLIKLGRNITSTHQAFKRYTKEMLDDIRNYGYTLIIDENVDVLESFEFHKDDLKLAVDAGYVKEENGTYSLVKDDYKGVAFQDMFSLLNCRTLIKVEDKDSLINETLFFWSLPPELITSFKDVIVLTYLFNVQNLRYFFDINKIKYEFVGVECKNGKYRFCEDTSNIPNHIGNLREMINILDNDKLNEIGEDKYALSMAWYDRNKDDVLRLKKNIYNVMCNVWRDVPFTKKMWGTYAGQSGKIRGKGYMNSFLVFNARATNAYADKDHLIYAANPFMNVGEKLFYKAYGITADENLYALSTMIQWVWRSALRVGKPVEIYIPSKRMRCLFEDWINKVTEKGGTAF